MLGSGGLADDCGSERVLVSNQCLQQECRTLSVFAALNQPLWSEHLSAACVPSRTTGEGSTEVCISENITLMARDLFASTFQSWPVWRPKSGIQLLFWKVVKGISVQHNFKFFNFQTQLQAFNVGVGR
jgi:hypothetical protein